MGQLACKKTTCIEVTAMGTLGQGVISELEPEVDLDKPPPEEIQEWDDDTVE